MRNTAIEEAVSAIRGPLLALAGFSSAMNLLALASPIYMLQIYDRVIPSRSIETLVMLTLITAAALAVMSALDALRRAALDRLGDWLDGRVYGPVLAASVSNALRSGGEPSLQATRDLATLRAFVGGASIVPLLDAPWTPIFLIALLVLHPLLGAVGFFGMLLMLGLAVLNEKCTRAPLDTVSLTSSRLQHRLAAALRNAEVIHAMGMLGGVARLLHRDKERITEAQRTASHRGGIVLAFSKYARVLLQTIIMGVGAWIAIDSHGSPGIVFAASFLLSRSLSPVENAIGTWKAVTNGRLAYRRLVGLLRTSLPAAIETRLPRPEGGLRVEAATYIASPTAPPLLHDISFALAPGQALGVIGPSGAGKSSLARLVTGAWPVSAGRVRLDGADIGIWLASGGACHLGYLPQDVELFDATVKQNIARLADAEPDDVIAAARLAGVHDFIMGLPRAYDTEIGSHGVPLSGGQRQRIGLARAVFGGPRLVVLDEPDASLDNEGEIALRDAILRLKESGTVVLVVTHRVNILEAVDKLLLLRRGVMEMLGTRDEVIARLNAPPQRPKVERPAPVAEPVAERVA